MKINVWQLAFNSNQTRTQVEEYMHPYLNMLKLQQFNELGTNELKLVEISFGQGSF